MSLDNQMANKLVLFLWCVSVLLTVCQSGFVPPSSKAELEWWQTAAIYQIYPRSFKDTNNDGIGDLRGIIEKLQFIKDTGFNGIWLSPIYPSPMVDFGYDVSDYRGIAAEYGTMADFDELVSICKTMGLRVLMDFIPNHSSDQHEWFKLSANNTPGYENYYVWKDPKGYDTAGNPIPPNNWLNAFRGLAWDFIDSRQQFYLHQFTPQQADLNYRDPKVVQEFKDIINYWIEKGVDGFRMDTVNHLFEDNRFEDEPLNYPVREDNLDFDYLNHIYVRDQPENFEMVQQWRETVEVYVQADGHPRFITLEGSPNLALSMNYYGTDERPGAHSPFNFQLLQPNSSFTALGFKRVIDEFMNLLPPGRWPNWVIGNHDNHRIGDRVGKDIKDGMNMLVTLLPGMSFSYQGEEIGMEDNRDITYEQGVDPQGCNYPPDQFLVRSRDLQRTPYQWDNSVNAGFNTGGPTWLPINKNYLELNLANQIGDPYSQYEIMRDLLRARQLEVIQTGNFIMNSIATDTLAFIRALSSDDFFLVLINLDETDEVIDADAAFLVGKNKNLTVYTASRGSGLLKGSTVPSTSINLKGRASVVLTYSATPRV